MQHGTRHEARHEAYYEAYHESRHEAYHEAYHEARRGAAPEADLVHGEGAQEEVWDARDEGVVPTAWRGG